jgi:hypothetical protein
MSIGAWLFSQEHKARLQAEAEAEKARRDYEILVARQTLPAPELVATLPKPAEKPAEKPKPIKKEKTETELLLRATAKERAAAALAQLPQGHLRIITGAGVRLRKQAEQNAKGKIILHLGTIVLELEKDGNWYKIETPKKQIGWVHAKYSQPLEPNKRAETYIKLAKKKLNRTSFGNLVDLCNFLSHASDTVELESAVELKLLYLFALQGSLRHISSEQPNKKRYSKWLKKHDGEIRYKNPRAAWFVKKEAFQALYNKYRFLPISERILREMPD